MADFNRVLEEIQKIKEFELLKGQNIDPIGIMEEKRSSIEKYNYDTALRIAKNAITGAFKRLENTEEFEGILLSNFGVDRCDSKAPISYPMLFKDGTIQTVSAWSHHLFKGIGKYKILGNMNDVYKNIIVEKADKDETFDLNKIPEFLTQIVMTPNSDFSKNEKYQTVLINGIINWISPVPIWEENEKIGVEKPFDDAKKPVFNITLETGFSSSGTKNHITFVLQKNKAGSIEINHPEIQTILDEVSLSEFKDIEQAMEELTILFKGISISAIGQIISLKDNVTNSNEPITYITLKTLKILDLNAPAPIPEVKKVIKNNSGVTRQVMRGVEGPNGGEVSVAVNTNLEIQIEEVKNIAKKLEKLYGRMPTMEETKQQFAPEHHHLVEIFYKHIQK